MQIKQIHIFLFALLLLPSIANSQIDYDNWQVLMKAQNSVMRDSLAQFGIRTDATAGFENQYDIPRPPRAPSGIYLEIYFPHSGGAYPPTLGTRYAIDYQGAVDPVWNLSVEASSAGPVTITWDSSYIQSIEPRVQLFLLDLASGTLTNMRTAGHYAFTYSVKRDFQIVGAITVDLTYLMEGFWNGAAQVQDTVSGYLALSSSPYTVVDSAKVVLSSSGTGMMVFPHQASGSYYLIIRHRNHLEIWSAAPLPLIKGTTSYSSYDFSASGSTAYGTNALLNSGGTYVAWGGDVDQNGVVDYRDRNLGHNNRGLVGYLPTDCNGDNTTNASDYTIILNNRLRTLQRP
jgi:hypothetical protein